MEQWIEEISNSKKHIHQKRIQAEEFHKRKEEMEEGELIVQCDCSENYKNVEQNEIQSAYFGHPCFSIYTACGYCKTDDKLIKNPITIIMEASDHSRIAAFTCFSKVVHTIQFKMQVPLRKVYAWSDGMGEQFRSHFVFKLLTTFDREVDLEWHYTEAHHGKGPMDGVGGIIKNQVFQEVKSGRLTVSTPKEFSDATQKLVPSITSVYLPLSKILEEPDDINEAPKIPETLQIHKVKRSCNLQGIPLIEFFKLSNEELPYHTHYYGKPTDLDLCGHRESNVNENKCGYCLTKWGENEKEEWLQCPISTCWFHVSIFRKD